MRKKQQARVFTSAVTTGYKWNSDAKMKKKTIGSKLRHINT